MYKKFEGFTRSLSKGEPTTSYWNTGISRHYTRGLEKPWSCSVSWAWRYDHEVALLRHMGQLVDWLSNKQPRNLLSWQQVSLMGLGVLLLVVMPILINYYCYCCFIKPCSATIRCRFRWLTTPLSVKTKLIFLSRWLCRTCCHQSNANVTRGTWNREPDGWCVCLRNGLLHRDVVHASRIGA